MVCLLYSVDACVLNMWLGVACHAIHVTKKADRLPLAGSHSV